MRRLFPLFALMLLPAVASADAKNPTYDDDVLPILKQHCASCHGNDKQKSGLNVATLAAIKQGGAGGEVLKAGAPDKSRLYTLTAHTEEPKMPPSGTKIPDAQIAILKLWIDQGARENSGTKVVMPEKPKVNIGLTNVGKGKPEGPPPMPQAGKLKLDPIYQAKRPGAVLAMAASPWAPIIAIGGQKQVLLFHADNGDYLGSLPFDHGQINALKFSRNSKLLLAAGGKGGASGKAVLYNIETCEKVTEVGIETDALLCADISADQKLIAVGSPAKLIRIYNTSDGTVASEIKKHTDWVTALEFSPDGVLLATGDRNGGLFVWEAATGREFHSLRNHTLMITDLSWRYDSNALASSSEDGTVRLWEMENGSNFKGWAAHGGGAASVRYAKSGMLASTGRDKVIKTWDQNGALQKQSAPLPDIGLRVVYGHDDTKFISGDWSGGLFWWSTADAKELVAMNSNPAPLAVRIQTVEAMVAAADAKLKQHQAAFTGADTNHKNAIAAVQAAEARVNQLNAELAAANKAVTDTTNAANAAKAAVAPAKAEVDKYTAAVPNLMKIETDKQAALNAANKAASDAAEAAKKTPADAKLAEAAKKAAEAAKTMQPPMDAAKKAVADNAAALKTATDKFNAVTKAANDAVAVQTEAAKKPGVIQPQIAPAQAAIAPAKTNADNQAKAVAPAKAALDVVQAEFNVVKARLDRLKPPPPPVAVAPPPPAPMPVKK
jgi:Planctomycete cytochrome C/WD domain, G-beta repeat